MANISVHYRSFKGISNLSITRLSDNLVMSFPKPMSFNLADNTQMKEQMSRDDTGLMGIINTYPTQKSSSLTISYSSSQLELFATKLNKKMETATDIPIMLPRLVYVDETLTIPGASGNTEWGFGIVADVVDAIASYTSNSTYVTTPVEQNSSGNWNSWKSSTTPYFGVGANGALYFSTALKYQIVSLSIPYVINGMKMTNNLFGDVRIDTALVDSANKISFIKIPVAQLNPSGAALSDSGEQMDLTFYVNTPPGKCDSYQLIETDKYIVCD